VRGAAVADASQTESVEGGCRVGGYRLLPLREKVAEGRMRGRLPQDWRWRQSTRIRAQQSKRADAANNPSSPLRGPSPARGEGLNQQNLRAHRWSATVVIAGQSVTLLSSRPYVRATRDQGMPKPTDILNALKIFGLSLIVGPPVGALVGVIANSLTYAWGLPPSPLQSLEGLALWPLHLAFAVFTGLFLIPGAVLLAYLLATPLAAASAALFVLGNGLAPARWPRVWLGALCGLIPVAAFMGPDIASAPMTNLFNADGYMLAAGLVSGWVCARVCERAGWTR